MSESYVVVETCKFEGVQKIHLLSFRDKVQAERYADRMNRELFEDLLTSQRDYIRSLHEQIGGSDERGLMRLEMAEAELRRYEALGLAALSATFKVITLQEVSE